MCLKRLTKAERYSEYLCSNLLIALERKLFEAVWTLEIIISEISYFPEIFLEINFWKYIHNVFWHLTGSWAPESITQDHFYLGRLLRFSFDLGSLCLLVLSWIFHDGIEVMVGTDSTPSDMTLNHKQLK